MKCPVCGKYEFEEYDDYDICPVCNWENDGLQYNDHNYAGGANDLSVNEAMKKPNRKEMILYLVGRSMLIG